MSKLFHGRIEGIWIWDVLDGMLNLMPKVQTVLVRGIDSGRSRDELIGILDFHRIEYSEVQGNVILGLESIRKALDHEVFTGFDEVWLLEQGPPSIPLGLLPPATSDTRDFADEIPPEIIMAVGEIHCVLLLGDGCGLNYLTSDETISKALVKMSNSHASSNTHG